MWSCRDRRQVSNRRSLRRSLGSSPSRSWRRTRSRTADLRPRCGDARRLTTARSGSRRCSLRRGRGIHTGCRDRERVVPYRRPRERRPAAGGGRRGVLPVRPGNCHRVATREPRRVTARRASVGTAMSATRAARPGEFTATSPSAHDSPGSMSDMTITAGVHEPDTDTEALVVGVLTLRRDARELEEACRYAIDAVPPADRPSARNLVHYVAIRRHDIRSMQLALAAHGLSSLGQRRRPCPRDHRRRPRPPRWFTTRRCVGLPDLPA